MTAKRAGRRLQARCAIAGGGPAGVMLGYLLARAGVEVVVLEKHRDFFRDFRGDTVHPSTLEVMAELGLLERLLQRPHQELRAVRADIDGRDLALADFSHLPVCKPFVALMPQWDFLDFLAEEARRFAAFSLLMETEVLGLTEREGRVCGLSARGPQGTMAIEADLVVGADGRHSIVRQAAGLPVRELGAPIDVLWLRISKRPSDPQQNLGRLERGRFLITLDRGDYWQCAFVILKGGLAALQARGLEALRGDIAVAAPFFSDRLGEIAGWDDVKLLTVKVDRLERWSRPGLLCIGDAAHAMSPIGGVGINLALQDAVAAANLLAAQLRSGPVPETQLDAVRRRREPPTRLTQAVQVFIQDRILSRVVGRDRPAAPPLPLLLLNAFPPLRRIPARFIGLGARPEHVSPALARLFQLEPARAAIGS